MLIINCFDNIVILKLSFDLIEQCSIKYPHQRRGGAVYTLKTISITSMTHVLKMFFKPSKMTQINGSDN